MMAEVVNLNGKSVGYGIEKGFYRREGIDLDFRMIRTDLAVAAMVSSREVDYREITKEGFKG